jgi:hypothetical protein
MSRHSFRKHNCAGSVAEYILADHAGDAAARTPCYRPHPADEVRGTVGLLYSWYRPLWPMCSAAAVKVKRSEISKGENRFHEHREPPQLGEIKLGALDRASGPQSRRVLRGSGGIESTRRSASDRCQLHSTAGKPHRDNRKSADDILNYQTFVERTSRTRSSRKALRDDANSCIRGDAFSFLILPAWLAARCNSFSS